MAAKTKYPIKWNLERDFGYRDNNDPKIDKDFKSYKNAWKKFIDKYVLNEDFDYKVEKNLEELLFELEKIEEKHQSAGPAILYLHFRKELNSEDAETKAKLSSLDSILSDVSKDMPKMSIKLGKTPAPLQKKLLSNPKLAKFHYFLTKIFDRAKYKLTPEAEEVLTLMQTPAITNWDTLLDKLMNREIREVRTAKGKKEKKNFAQLSSLLTETDSKVRAEAGNAIYDILDSKKDIAEYEFNSFLECERVERTLRKHERPESMALLRDDVDAEVVDALVESVSDNFKIAHRYYALLHKLLKHKGSFDYYDRAVNFEIPGTAKEVPYNEAAELVIETFSEVDPEFGKVASEMIEGSYIDVEPGKAKHSGAYCHSTGSKFPVYIFMNYTKKLTDVTTLAHEMGHALHAHYYLRNQPVFYRSTSLATAEVASTVFENIILEKIAEKANEKLAFNLKLSSAFDGVQSALRQIAGYKFERELHEVFNEKRFLRHEEIGEIFNKHMKSYLGPRFKMTEKSGLNWIAWSHFRRPFYVYSYASGLLISKAIQNMMITDKVGTVEKIMKFFKAGTSKSTKDIFMDMGIDITKKAFWDKGMLQLEAEMKEIEKLAKKLNLI